MAILLRYRFFVLIAISALLHYFHSDGESDLAIIVFFIAILDLSNVLSKKDK